MDGSDVLDTRVIRNIRQPRFLVSAAERLPLPQTFADTQRLVGEDQSFSCRHQCEFVAILVEDELRLQLLRPLPTAKQQSIRPVLLADEELQPLLRQLGQHLEQADKIALAGPIGSDQHVQVAQLKVFEGADGFKAANGKTI